MKQLIVKKLDGFDPVNDWSLMELHPIASDNWNYSSHVNAKFGICHDLRNIYLRYLVNEFNIQARYRNTHDPVYEDSCVEFFISFDKASYYNLEFNCIGTMLGAYGKNRKDRVKLEEELLGTIKVTPSLGTNKIQIVDRETEWTLDVIIPVSVFKFSDPGSLQHQTANCNFYKCGDKLTEPHYLSWNPIVSEKPDFHSPEYFGKLKFV